MNKVKTFFSETIRDWFKDNIKLAIGYITIFVISLIPNFIDKINSIVFSVTLSFIISLSFSFIMLIVSLFILFKKYKIIKAENEKIKNPTNSNVNNFHQGDTVILKIDADLPWPPKLSVYKTTPLEIVCRTNGGLINYAPEELLTKDETTEIFRRIEYRRRQVEQENKERFEGYF